MYRAWKKIIVISVPKDCLNPVFSDRYAVFFIFFIRVRHTIRKDFFLQSTRFARFAPQPSFYCFEKVFQGFVGVVGYFHFGKGKVAVRPRFEHVVPNSQPS